MTDPYVIAGGGIAGSVAAICLARAGHAPLLLERSRTAHHKVCGEFVSWEAAERLRAIGFDLGALGGSRIDRVRLFGGARRVEARLPKVATGISRFALDEALLAHAATCGARVERGVAVRSITAGGEGLMVEAGGEIAARIVLLATGKSNLRGLARRVEDQPTTGDLVGFKAHYRLRAAETAALAGAVELHLLEGGGYAGLQLVEGGVANLCWLVPRTLLRAGDGAPDAVFADAGVLQQRLSGAEMLFERPLAISGVPYGFIHRPRPDDAAGLRRLGDQFAVVHSFTGDGMAIAAASGELAARAQADRFDPALRRRVLRPVTVSSLLHAGLRAPRMRAFALALAGFWPGLVTGAARLTRIAG